MRGRLSPLWPRDVIFWVYKNFVGGPKDESKVFLERHKSLFWDYKMLFSGFKKHVLDIFQKPPGFRTTAREHLKKCLFWPKQFVPKSFFWPFPVCAPKGVVRKGGAPKSGRRLLQNVKNNFTIDMPSRPLPSDLRKSESLIVTNCVCIQKIASNTTENSTLLPFAGVGPHSFLGCCLCRVCRS